MPESKIAELFGSSGCALFGRARSGLRSLLETLSKDKQFPFLIPSNICPSVAAAGIAANARVILIDVDPLTGLPTDEKFLLEMQQFNRPGVLMLTYLYGFFEEYKKSLEYAKKKGWFIIENDTSAVRAIYSKSNFTKFEGDALLASFGSGKVIDCEIGGAIISNDSSLIGELKKMAGTYPLYNKYFKTIEEQLVSVRRLLRGGRV